MTWTKITKATLGSPITYSWGTQPWGTSPYGGSSAENNWTKITKPSNTWTKIEKAT